MKMIYIKPKEIKLFGKIRTSDIELRDLFKAWAVISVAFAVAIVGFAGLFSEHFVTILIVTSISVGSAFLFHELAHKLVAQSYGYSAEFRSFDQMLGIALLMSFFGFILAAPGGVMIPKLASKKRGGIIAASGPATNVVLALVFFGISRITDVFPELFTYGFMINAWLALFNSLPIGAFDGRKVFEWSRPVWAVLMAFAAILVFIF